MIFNMRILHFITQVQHYSTQTLILSHLSLCLALGLLTVLFITRNRLQNGISSTIQNLFQLMISLQIPDRCPLFQFT